MKKFKFLAAIAGVLLASLTLGFADSFYATHATASEITFKPVSKPVKLTAMLAKSDKAGSLVKIYSWDKVKVHLVTAAASASATTVSVATASTYFAGSDILVFVHKTGTVEKRVVSSATTSTVVISAGLTYALEVGDRIFEMKQDYLIPVGSAALNLTGEQLYDAGPGPIYMVLDSTSAGSLAASFTNDQ